MWATQENDPPSSLFNICHRKCILGHPPKRPPKTIAHLLWAAELSRFVVVGGSRLLFAPTLPVRLASRPSRETSISRSQVCAIRCGFINCICTAFHVPINRRSMAMQSPPSSPIDFSSTTTGVGPEVQRHPSRVFVCDAVVTDADDYRARN